MFISSMQSTALGSISNVLAQVINAWRHSIPLVFSWTEFWRFTMVMALLSPPVYYWQIWMEATWPGHQHHPKGGPAYLPVASDYEMHEAGRPSADSGTASRRDHSEKSAARRTIWRNILIKWCVDNSAGAVWYTLLFIVLIEISKLNSPAGILKALLRDTLPLLLPQYVLWPAATLINFIWVPVEKRLVFLAFVGLIWGVYLSIFEAEPPIGAGVPAAPAATATA